MKISRRRLAALLAPAAAVSQTPQVKPATPEDELAAARKRLQNNLEILRKTRIDMAVEPDFTFKA
jgi:hypothetical protein